MGSRTVYVTTDGGTISPLLMGTGTDIGTKFLRGDGTWAAAGAASWWSGTQAEYDALASTDPDTLYYVTG